MARNRPRFAKFKINDWLGLLRAYFYLLIAGWKVHLVRADLRPWLSKSLSLGSEHLEMLNQPDSAKKAWAYVDIAARHPFPWARCLQRSLALCLWLRAQGCRPILRIGVRRIEFKLEAHAWVEYQGQTFGYKPEAENVFIPLQGAKELHGDYYEV